MRFLTVVELEPFLSGAKGILSESEIDDLKNYLAANPDAGALVPGTGGARKLRWAAQGKGKNVGGRTICYFHSEAMPLFLTDFYTKGSKKNLTEKEKKAFRNIVGSLVTESLDKE